MTAKEIVDKVKAGELVMIAQRHIMTFMRECDDHNLSISCYVSCDGRVCKISKDKLPSPSRRKG